MTSPRQVNEMKDMTRFLPLYFLLVLGFAGSSSAVLGALERPNILFIMSDDHTSQAFGAYGSRLAKLNPTPVIDRLAKEGMLFENCFCNNSICTPSRASIITGQYSQANGVLTLRGRIPPARQFLPTLMRQAGYLTAMVGKWHLKEEPAAFDYYKVLPGQGKYHDPIFRVQGKAKWPKNTVSHKGQHSSDAITDSSLAWLRARDKSKPFFLMHHFKAPHDMFDNARRYDTYLEDVEIPEPESLYERGNHGSVATRGVNDSLLREIGTSVSKRHIKRNMGKHMKVDPSLGDREYTKLAYQRYLKRYLRCVKGVDDNVGRLFRYLEAEGLMDKTVIIYTGDQGFMLGEHDYIDKRWMYEESMRMPLLVRYPSMIKAGSRNNELVNNTDFAPTILALAGVKTPAYMQGRSFSEMLRGSIPGDWRTATYYRYWMHMAHHWNPAHFGIRTKRHKLIFYYGLPISGKENATLPAWELYDMEKDPREMNNVYADPAYARIRTKLKDELKRVRGELKEEDTSAVIREVLEKHWKD